VVKIKPRSQWSESTWHPEPIGRRLPPSALKYIHPTAKAQRKNWLGTLIENNFRSTRHFRRDANHLHFTSIRATRQLKVNLRQFYEKDLVCLLPSGQLL
jgi:hypothetical protein